MEINQPLELMQVLPPKQAPLGYPYPEGDQFPRLTFTIHSEKSLDFEIGFDNFPINFIQGAAAYASEKNPLSNGEWTDKQFDEMVAGMPNYCTAYRDSNGFNH